MKRVFKKCITCERNLMVSEKNFYKASENIDGFTNQCKSCRNEAKRANYYKKVAGKLDVVKEVKAPKINTDAIQKAIQECRAMGDKLQYRFNNFNKVRIQRNISIIFNILIGSVLIYFILN